jgi:uncharacterized membrane protein YidH (DUF202 family)
VSIGLISLMLATIEYRCNIRMLDGPESHGQHSLAVIVAALISVLGILALFVVIFRQ